MRIVTWNVNGLGTFMNYHPFSTHKSRYDLAFADTLNADVVCLQELKTPRSKLTRQQACPLGYDAFLSFPANLKGYSGVGTYTRQGTLVPLKAQEGITGILAPRSSATPPSATDDASIGGLPDLNSDTCWEGVSLADLQSLDEEGRSVAIDCGLFVLFNLYCPHETDDDRLPYKLNFLHMLEARVRSLIALGRQVIVVGDMNVVHRPEDHGEGSLASKQNGFWDHPARQWFDNVLAPKGPLTDVTRRAHPDRKGMYTCWNVKTGARPSNYGTRLDYILVTEGLLPWVKTADICPEIKGSDHCPVFVEFHDSLVLPGDSNPTLFRDLLNPSHRVVEPPGPNGQRRAVVPPRFAAMYHEAFAIKSIRSFFAPKGVIPPTTWQAPGDVLSSSTLRPSSPSSLPLPPVAFQLNPPKPLARLPSEPVDLTLAPSSPPILKSPSSSALAKGKVPDRSSAKESKPSSRSTSNFSTLPPAKKKPEPGQKTLTSFFAPPSAPPSQKKRKKVQDSSAYSSEKRARTSGEDDDYALALSLSQLDEHAPASSSTKTPPQEDVSKAWSSLLAPAPKPRCTVHNVEGEEHTVTKKGPNKGKRFWLCSQPLGPGHDSFGKSKGRIRDEVNVAYKVSPAWQLRSTLVTYPACNISLMAQFARQCDFFMWSKDVKRNHTGAVMRGEKKA